MHASKQTKKLTNKQRENHETKSNFHVQLQLNVMKNV